MYNCFVLFFAVFSSLSFHIDAIADDESYQEDLTVRLIADEWCPYTCSETDKDKGLIVDVAAAAFNEVGMQVTYKSSSWARAIREVQSGSSDALLGADAGIRKELFLAEDFLILEEAVFVVLEGGGVAIETPADLQKYKIGYMANYSYGKDANWQSNIENHPNAVPLSGTYDEARLIELLTNKRIEMAVMNIDVAKQYLRNHPERDKVKFIRKDITSNLHIGFSPSLRGKELHSKFLEGYQRLKSTDKLKDIYIKYGVEMPSH